MPLPALLGAIAPAVIGGLVNAGTSAIDAARQQSYNFEMAKWQNARNIEFWNMQNAYNTPAMQMQRFKEAGLNPNLIYGQGNPGNAAAIQSAKADAVPGVVPQVDFMSMLNQYQDYQIKAAQTDNLYAQRKAIEANVGRTQLQSEFLQGSMYDRLQKEYIGARKLDWEQMLADMKQQAFSQMFPYQLSFQQGRVRQQDVAIEKMLADMDKVKLQSEYQRLVNDWYVTKLFGGFAKDFMTALPKARPSLNRRTRMLRENPRNWDRFQR